MEAQLAFDRMPTPSSKTVAKSNQRHLSPETISRGRRIGTAIGQLRSNTPESNKAIPEPDRADVDQCPR